MRQALEIVAAVCDGNRHSMTCLSNCNGSSDSNLGKSSGTKNRLMVHPLKRRDGDEGQVEIKVSRHGITPPVSTTVAAANIGMTTITKTVSATAEEEENDDENVDERHSALIAVIRDVTERHRRFEAEKRAHSETVQRQRDAQAVNRFTRHEVKNGLLAGIELCDSMRSSFEAIEKSLKIQKHKDVVAMEHAEKSRKIMQELDNMLHEVLDTVLAEAMARDVIHEVYQPRLETLDVKGLLTSSNIGIGTIDKYPVELPGHLPYLLLDPQLLRYIHRNAFSNACKYGKQDGKVLTIVEYDEARRILEMKVINEPGKAHAARKWN